MEEGDRVSERRGAGARPRARAALRRPKQLADLRRSAAARARDRGDARLPALEPVVVVLGARRRRDPRARRLRGADIVVCEDWADGQAASLQRGLAALGDVERGRDHARRPAVHDAAGDRRRARRARRTRRGPRRLRRRPGPSGRAGAARCSTPSPSSRATPARATLLSPLRVRQWEAGHLCERRPTSTRREELAAADEARAVASRCRRRSTQVWAALNDLERVAPCLPGAAITGPTRTAPTTASSRSSSGRRPRLPRHDPDRRRR